MLNPCAWHVDTNGNTYFKRVEASFLQSSLVATGSVYDDDAHKDTLFARGDGKGGSAIPFTISGTRSRPTFGLDYGRVFKR